jgi:glycosyltransferase involved in cell wall biosynthesis
MIPDISIVIPTYQRPDLLMKCLSALRKQTFPHERYGVIVVTDGPDGHTRKIMNEYREKSGMQLYCWSLPMKKGPAAARNFGWKNAHGKFIIFIDDDCLPDVNLVAAYWNAFQQSHEKCIVFTGRVNVPLPEYPTDYELNVSHLETSEFVTANCACAKECLERVGGFDEAFEIAWREDSDLQFRFMDANIPIKKVNEAEVMHPARKTFWGVSLKEQRKALYDALLYKKHPKHFRTRIFKHPNWHYYGVILSVIAVGIGLITKNKATWLFAFTGMLLIALFTMKRLRHTSRSPAHISEMIITSFFIPFLSVYWTLYGAIRYRTWFL